MKKPDRRQAESGLFGPAELELDFTPEPEFHGTDSPRHLRVLRALLNGPLPREQLDSIAGCSNGPNLVAELRGRGLDVPCVRITCMDRDGRECRAGVYRFSAADRVKVVQWLSQKAVA